MISIPVRYRDAAGRLYADDISVDEARALVASLQRQLDALDPDAAIAEAERRMVEAWERARALSGMAGSVLSNVEETLALEHARDCALETWDVRKAAWLELVEAREAKGGGV